MDPAARQTRSYLMKLFEEQGFHPRHDLGQNFLIDLNIIEFIVKEGLLTKRDVVLEVGTGTGSMTSFMAQQAGHVISVDVDRNMNRLAQKQTEQYDNVTLLLRDALKNKNHFAPELIEVVREKLTKVKDARLKLVSNLPYSIATPVVSNLVASDLPWYRMVVTIQLELALRMQAKPSTSNYGSLSVWLQSQTFVKMLKRLPPSVFWPRPKVNSAIVLLKRDAQSRDQILDRPFYQDYLRRLFHHRRKMLRSVVVGMYRKQMTKQKVDQILQDFGLSENVRAEELGPPMHVALANTLYHAMHAGEAAEPPPVPSDEHREEEQDVEQDVEQDTEEDSEEHSEQQQIDE